MGCRDCPNEKRRAWDKFLAIVEGWTNLVWKNSRMEEIAKNRAKICSSCDQLSALGVCKKCSCPVAPLTRQMRKSCPLNKWTANK